MVALLGLVVSDRTDPVPAAQPGAAGLVAGIDLGGTKIMAGLAALDGTPIAVVEQPTRHGDGAPFLAQIREIVAALVAGAGSGHGSLVHAVVGVPGSIAPATGHVSLSPNLAFPPGRSAAALIADLLGCPVAVENDVGLAAYGEAMLGHGDGRGLLAFVSFGTGVGLGLVAGGEILRGAHGRAGEIGYLPIGAAPHARAPASVGGLYEDAVGSAGIQARYGDDGPTVAEIFERAAFGEAAARAAIDDVARIASTGLASVQTLFDPDTLVLGGSIGARPEFAGAIRRHLASLLPYRCEIRVSALGREAGLRGALHAAARAAAAGKGRAR